MTGLSDEYVKRLIDYALESGQSASRWTLTRYSMYTRLSKLLAAEDSPDKLALSVARSTTLIRSLGLSEVRIQELAYPEYDLAALHLPDAHADFIVSDQVLEHVAGGPFAAFAESRRVIRPGGFIVHTSCLINEIHQAPYDYWRFTPHALEMLADTFDLEAIEIGAWGNRAASALIHLGYRKAVLPEAPENPLHAIGTHSEKKHPIVVWMIARRPDRDGETRASPLSGTGPTRRAPGAPAAKSSGGSAKPSVSTAGPSSVAEPHLHPRQALGSAISLVRLLSKRAAKRFGGSRAAHTVQSNPAQTLVIDSDFSPSSGPIEPKELVPRQYLEKSGWFRSRALKLAVDAAGAPVPWLTYSAIHFLTERVESHMRVFEYGSGQSTLWWAARAAHVTAVEHDVSWYEYVSQGLPSNVELLNIELGPEGRYAEAVSLAKRAFHVIVVDGRNRNDCANRALSSLRPDGVIVWDNTERVRYKPGMEMLAASGFARIPFRGLAPGRDKEMETSIFYRPANCFGI